MNTKDLDNICYLDYAATSPLLKEAGEVLLECLNSFWGNPSSRHGLGVKAGEKLEEARGFIGGTLGTKRVVFTSCATESNNLAVFGSSRKGKKGKILALKTDHASILEPLKIAANEGHQVFLMSVDKYGIVNLNELSDLLDGDVKLVCFTYGNNETGVIQPVKEIISIIKEKSPDAKIHVDFVQGYGRVRLDIEDDMIDSISISGHKIGAPKGIGCLAHSTKIEPIPLLYGGGQEGGIRSGTENVPSACAFAKASEIAYGLSSEENKRLKSLKIKLRDGILDTIPWAVVNTPEDNSLPNILNISFPGIPSEVLQHHLEEKQIYVGTGAACTARKKKTSHVLKAMGLPQEVIESAIRFSFGMQTKDTHIDKVLQVLPEITKKLKPGKG